jgi:hypothetical protein
LLHNSVAAAEKFKIPTAKGKWQMENHLKFAICHLQFDFLCLSLMEEEARTSADLREVAEKPLQAVILAGHGPAAHPKR